ncbi:MAG: cohesin domain-containing protein [Patescibacteria group bacterium]
MKRKLLWSAAAIFIAILLAPLSARAATSFELYPTKVSVKAGQFFTLTVRINPAGVKNYTVKASIKFPADLVSVQTWKYSNVWMPLRKGSYDYSSNSEGVFIRTAGYPEGFSKITTLGTLTFLAKKSGKGTIEFSGENLALDENNTNQFSGGTKVNLTVLKKEAAVAPSVSSTISTVSTTTATTTEEQPLVEAPIEPEVSEQAPEQLFDINLELDHSAVLNIDDLGARAYFISFGNVPTPVDITFDILNDKGEVVFTKQGTTTVETERVYNENFIGANLPAGNYTLRLTTLYNTDVRDEFSQPFKIITPAKAVVQTWVYWVIGGVIALILIIVIIIIIRRRNNKRPKNYYPGNSVRNHQ